jgi:hypothetical protein
LSPSTVTTGAVVSLTVTPGRLRPVQRLGPVHSLSTGANSRGHL